MIEIRKAVPSDLGQIELLYNDLCDYLEMNQNYPGWKKGVYPVREDAEIALREACLFVVQEESRIVGTFILRHKPEDGYKNAAWLTENDYACIYVIYTLAVHPNDLQRGVGTEILKYVEDYARKEHCISIRLDVGKGNIPAERLYQNNGYRLIDTVSLGYEEYGLPWYNLYEKVF